MTQINFTRSILSLLASTVLHCTCLLGLLVIVTGEPANQQALLGKTAALTIHIISASSPAFSPDVSTEDSQPDAHKKEPLLSLPANERGMRPPDAVKPKRQTVPSQKKPLTSLPATPSPTSGSVGQSANRGQDRLQSEEGIAAQTSLKPMTGRGEDEMAVYAARLRNEIESHKRYPLRAKQSRTGGVVRVRFNIEADGSLTSPQVISSSGNRDLDNAALQAVQQSNGIGPKPPGFSRSVSVNIRFSLLR